MSCSKTRCFTMNYALFFKITSFYNELYTVRLGAILRPFWHREGSMAEPSRAEPSRAGPGRAEPSRAEPSQTEPIRADSSRAVPNRAKPSRAGGDSHVIFLKNTMFHNELCVFIPLMNIPCFTMNLTTLL